MITLTDRGLFITGETIYVDERLIDRVNSDFDFSRLINLNFVANCNLICSPAKPKRHQTYVLSAYKEFDKNLPYVDAKGTVYNNKFIGDESAPAADDIEDGSIDAV